MVEIIQGGIKRKKLFAFCENCKCVFKFDKSDLQGLDYDDWDYSSHWYIRCPSCFHKILYRDAYDDLEKLKKNEMV